MAKYEARQGDCISSIAYEHGLFWQTVWEHAENAALREKRQRPNLLMPGDVVFIPEKRVETYLRPTDQRHRFVMKGVPAKLRVRFTNAVGPRADVPYTLAVDGATVSKPGARTDSDGWVDCTIPPTARQGTLLLGEGPTAQEYTLRLGHLNPVDTWSGVKQRLTNLGFYTGTVDDAETDEATSALREFQRHVGMQPTGKLGEDAREALRKGHDE